MNPRDRFIDKYIEGSTPWVHKSPDFNLIDMVENWPLHPCKVLELGCGTGVEAVWLAQNGFDVTAIDGSPLAIENAKQIAAESKVDCDFKVIDFIAEEVNGKFDLIFDRGFFHSFDTLEDRGLVAAKASDLLVNRGIWLTLMASSDAPPRDSGPPMRSAKDIVDSVEPYFKLLTLTVSHFGNEQKNPPKIWVCLMRKR